MDRRVVFQLPRNVVARHQVPLMKAVLVKLLGRGLAMTENGRLWTQLFGLDIPTKGMDCGLDPSGSSLNVLQVGSSILLNKNKR